MGAFWRDVRYGLRVLLKQRGFTTVAVLTLALGIGVNTALFTVFDAFALRPLPLKAPETLVQIYGRDRAGRQQNLFSYLDYLDYRDRNRVFTGLVAMNKVAAPVGAAAPGGGDDAVLTGDTEYAFLQIVSGNYFSVLGADMALGRAFTPDEDRTPNAQPVIVLSYDYWQRHFNADRHVIGQAITLRGRPFQIIGVAERGFIGTQPDEPAGWVPLMMRDVLLPAGSWNYRRWLTDRDADSFSLVARLQPGVTRAHAQAELNLLAQQLAQSYPGEQRKQGVSVQSGMTFVNLNKEEMAFVTPLLLAVGLVLLIACANVANLLLARAATRQKEIGVRLALGATRARLVSQLLTESLLLSLLGGAAGLLLAVWTLHALYPLVLAALPLPAALKESFALNLEPDYRIFSFTLLTAVVAGLAAGLAPALQASKPDLVTALKDEGSTLSQRLSQSKLRSALVVVQVAVSLMLLIGAGLLVRNVRRAQTVETGLETKHLLALAVSLRPQDGRDEAAVRRQLVERLRALPGVKAVGQAYRQPLAGAPPTTPVTLVESDVDQAHARFANYNFVSADYFNTLGLRLVRGRSFTQQEADTSAPVVVISEATARRFWPGEEPIGKRIGIGAAMKQEQSGNDHAGAQAAFPTFEVIGIARDARSGWVWQQDETYLYVPLGPTNQLGQYILIQTDGAPQSLVPMVRHEAEAMGDLLLSVRPLENSLAFQMAPFRALAVLAGALGLLALALAAVGLYGVMSFVVNQRTREIGIRLALGAERRDVVTLFLRQGLRLIVVGLGFGTGGGILLARLLAAALIDLSPLDPLAFGSVSIFLTVVALVACYLPARRATKVDPMIALRYE